MNSREAIEYIHSVSWLGSRPGLERIGELCRLLGHPENSLRFVHVAGTNGKGSTTAMLSAIFRAAGFKTGMFTSPYVLEFGERICVDGNPISGEDLADVVEYVRPFADAMASPPTEFELITAVGLEYFRRRGCDIVILEAGMGGRLDSTNIIEPPLLSVITGVALDHTEWLGDTTEKIAAEKAGIIKRGSPVVFGEGDGSARAVVERRASELNSPFTAVDYGRIAEVKFSLSGTRLRFAGPGSASGEYELGMLGRYQTKNAACVLTAVEVLRERGIRLSGEAVRQGLKEAHLHARFEIIGRDPMFIYDGGHNPQGVAAAVDNIHLLLEKKPVAVVGVMRDKEHGEMVKLLSGAVSSVHTVRPNNPRAMDAEDLSREFREAGVKATPHPSVGDGVRAAVAEAKSADAPVIALGSLYMYADVLSAVREAAGGELRKGEFD